jgi:hypothetical protein
MFSGVTHLCMDIGTHDQLWKTSYTRSSAKSQVRFLAILNMLYQNNNENKAPQAQYDYDVLHKIWPILEILTKKSQDVYTVKPLFIDFVGGLKKKQWIRENNRCGSHRSNRIRSWTVEIERRIRENELSGNDRQRFHCSHMKKSLTTDEATCIIWGCIFFHIFMKGKQIL